MFYIKTIGIYFSLKIFLELLYNIYRGIAKKRCLVV
ncbi:hypothetical protein LOK49_LG10G01624 [Camellia lanceoleosa]|uniref:Uncharacterized protein n=1 Tax=Camellia lanceoleosa TaxID=1840588 RepID=A0ACC0G877_9ERIC|nr:hypothetical protein LOK49_LG10G01624 [Camellia lanceoleosa]